MIEDGVQPDAFFEKAIIRQPADTIRKTLPYLSAEDTAMVKNQVVDWLKQKAVGGRSDNAVSTFSGLQMEKAMKSFGTKKLELLFSKEELNALKANAKVGQYEVAQPIGSAVNNSNSGVFAAAKAIEALKTAKIPLYSQTVAPVIRNIEAGFGARNALDPSKALLMPYMEGARLNAPLGLLTGGD
jgi:hypothetical protein